MSFEWFISYRRSFEGFLGRFPENNIWFIMYPFFKFYKVAGFCPVTASLEKYPNVIFYRDRRTWFYSLFCLVGATIGFSYAVYLLSQRESLGLHKTSTIISYITSWAQIISLFFLGCMALVTSWTNLKKMNKFIAKIRHIDFALEKTGATINYRALRKKLFIQTAVSFVIPTCLSMINCIMIKSPFVYSSSCYWFICFWPLLMLTMKELQFYNFMFLLKAKFNTVNQQIEQLQGNKFQNGPTMTMSLIAKRYNDRVMLVRKESKLIEQIRALGEVYSNTADCVDIILDTFASHLLITTCTSFAVITIQSYNLFALVVHSLAMQIHEIFFTVAWIIVQIMVIGVNVIACSQTTNAMADTASYLHRVRPKEDYALFLQMVQVFSLEILHRKKPMSAAGFFDMNFKLFTSIVAAVTTYLIIIIQFHLSNLQTNSAKNETSS